MKGILPSALFVFGAIATLGACQHGGEVVASAPRVDFSDGFQQSDADAIIEVCDARNIKLTVASTGEVTFEPSPTAAYEPSACVLRYIKESGTTKFGFVGNAKYVMPEEGQ